MEKPLTRVGNLVNRCWKASLRLWAGSVEMMSTEDRTWASNIPRMELQVVFPTPPFPPTNTHFNVSCSKIFCTEPSSVSAMNKVPSLLVLLSSSTVEMYTITQKYKVERQNSWVSLEEIWCYLLPLLCCDKVLLGFYLVLCFLSRLLKARFNVVSTFTLFLWILARIFMIITLLPKKLLCKW